MIHRIVRLEFDINKVQEFTEFFKLNYSVIASYPGCNSLKLMADADLPHVFYTISIWENKEALEKYRQSETFKHLWTFAKARFTGKPQAFSLSSL